MDRKKLENYRDLSRDILQLDAELEDEERQLDAIQYLTTDERLTKNIYEQSQKIRKLLSRQIRMRYREKVEIEHWIAHIEDKRIQSVIRLRYLSGMKWRDVAHRMGWSDEQLPRKVADHFLSKQD